MKNVFKIGILLILMIGLFVVPVSSNDLQVDDVGIEFVQADNTQNVILVQPITIADMFTGEGITLKHSADIANDLDMLGEAPTVQLNSNYKFYEDVITRDLQTLYRDPLVSNYRHPPELWTESTLTWNQIKEEEQLLNTGLFRLDVGELIVFV